DRGHPHPLDHPGAPLGDDREADEEAAEQAELHEQAGHEDPPGLVRGGAGSADEVLHQRPEQGEVQDRLDDPDDQPRGVAQRETQLPAEDQPGVSQGAGKAHRGLPVTSLGAESAAIAASSGLPSASPGCGGAPEPGLSSRSERPVSVRNTSSRVGRASWLDAMGAAAESSARMMPISCWPPASTITRSVLPLSVASRTPSTSPSADCAFSPSPSPASSMVTRSPEMRCLSSSGVPSATIRPKSMIRIRSQSASASSR